MAMATDTSHASNAPYANDRQYRIWVLTVLCDLVQSHNSRWDMSVNNLQTLSVYAATIITAFKAKQRKNSPSHEQMRTLNHLALALSRSLPHKQDQVVAIIASDYLIAGENEVTVAVSEPARLVPRPGSPPDSPTQLFISRNLHAHVTDLGSETSVEYEENSQDGISIKDEENLESYPLPYIDYVKTVVELILRCARLGKDRSSLEVELRRLDNLVVAHQLPRIKSRTSQIRKLYIDDKKESASLLSLKFPESTSFKFTPPSAWDVGIGCMCKLNFWPENLKSALLIELVEDKTAKADPGTDGQYLVNGLFFVTTLFKLLNSISEENKVPGTLIEFHAFMKLVPKEFWNSAIIKAFFEEKAAARKVADQKRADEAKDPSEGGGKNDDEDEDDDTPSTVGSDIDLEGMADSVKTFIRRIDSVSASTTATHFLVYRPIFRSAVEFKIKLIHSQYYTLQPGELDVNDLIAGWETKKLLSKKAANDLRDIRRQHPDRGDVSRGLSGGCHCEATLMAMLHASGSNTTAQLGSSRYTIGVSKKCCPFCWDLGQILNDKYNLNLALPGHHSVYSPWIPPSGLADDDLKELEKVLLGRLQDMLDVPHDRSNATSPGPSEPDDPQSIPQYDAYFRIPSMAQ
ncbi:hypothetical protein EIP91_011649 [Steccherinum ochraceum]|uniref:Uncharacterized protein n=1 Tax=Steccherinum ochraceum TaxID=92696 RepID=A0A4R0RHJ8_9APHY|nr:hypothetical protein EIP91_011649 [Steccherinum ochraceum]